MSEPEEPLVVAAMRGDAAAFDELVRRTARSVFAQLVLETGDVHAAEDLSQETFIAAFKQLHQLKEPKLFRPWLAKIARSVLTDAVRRQGRLKRQRGPADPPPPPSPDPLATAATEDDCQRMLSILRSMPAEYRRPLTLRYLADADYDTISRELGLTNGSLRGLLHRGLAMLRERLAPPGREKQS